MPISRSMRLSSLRKRRRMKVVSSASNLKPEHVIFDEDRFSSQASVLVKKINLFLNQKNSSNSKIAKLVDSSFQRNMQQSKISRNVAGYSPLEPKVDIQVLMHKTFKISMFDSEFPSRQIPIMTSIKQKTSQMPGTNPKRRSVLAKVSGKTIPDPQFQRRHVPEWAQSTPWKF